MPLPLWLLRPRDLVTPSRLPRLFLKRMYSQTSTPPRCPIMIRKWEQRCSELTYRWGISHLHATEGGNKPNPKYEPGQGQENPRRYNAITETSEASPLSPLPP
jgi:hypothetical protein